MSVSKEDIAASIAIASSSGILAYVAGAIYKKIVAPSAYSIRDQERYNELITAHTTAQLVIPAEWRLTDDKRPTHTHDYDQLVVEARKDMSRLAIDILPASIFQSSKGMLGTITSLFKSLAGRRIGKLVDGSVEGMFFTELSSWLVTVLPRLNFTTDIDLQKLLRMRAYCESVSLTVLVKDEPGIFAQLRAAEQRDNPLRALGLIQTDLDGIIAATKELILLTTFNEHARQLDKCIQNMAAQTFHVMHLLINRSCEETERLSVDSLLNPKTDIMRAFVKQPLCQYMVKTFSVAGITRNDFKSTKKLTLDMIEHHLDGESPSDPTFILSPPLRNPKHLGWGHWDYLVHEKSSHEAVAMIIKIRNLYRLVLKAYLIQGLLGDLCKVVPAYGETWLYGDAIGRTIIDTLMTEVSDVINEQEDAFKEIWDNCYKTYKSALDQPGHQLDHDDDAFVAFRAAFKEVSLFQAFYAKALVEIQGIKSQQANFPTHMKEVEKSRRDLLEGLMAILHSRGKESHQTYHVLKLAYDGLTPSSMTALSVSTAATASAAAAVASATASSAVKATAEAEEAAEIVQRELVRASEAVVVLRKAKADQEKLSGLAAQSSTVKEDQLRTMKAAKLAAASVAQKEQAAENSLQKLNIAQIEKPEAADAEVATARSAMSALKAATEEQKVTDAAAAKADEANEAAKSAKLALPAAILAEKAATAEAIKTAAAVQQAERVKIAKSTAARERNELAIQAVNASQDKLAEAAMAMAPVRIFLPGSLENPYSRDQMEVALAVQDIFKAEPNLSMAKGSLALVTMDRFCHEFHSKIYDRVLKPYNNEVKYSGARAWWHGYRGAQLETLQEHHSRFNHALQIIKDKLLPLEHKPDAYFNEQLSTINACLLINLRHMYEAMPWHQTVGVLFMERSPESKDVLKQTPDGQFHFMSAEGQVLVATSEAVAANTRAKTAEDRAVLAETATVVAKAENATAKAENATAKAEMAAAKAETATAKAEMAAAQAETARAKAEAATAKAEAATAKARATAFETRATGFEARFISLRKQMQAFQTAMARQEEIHARQVPASPASSPEDILRSTIAQPSAAPLVQRGSGDDSDLRSPKLPETAGPAPMCPSLLERRWVFFAPQNPTTLPGTGSVPMSRNQP